MTTIVADLQLTYLRKALARNLHSRRGCPADAALHIASTVVLDHQVETEKLGPLDLELFAEALSQEYALVSRETYDLALLFGDVKELGLSKFITTDGDPNDMELAEYVVSSRGTVVIDEDALSALAELKANPNSAPLIEELKAGQPEVFALCKLFGVED